MANFVTNRIQFFGNEKIDELCKEIDRRIREDKLQTEKYQDLSLVERIFYGQEHSDINWCYENIGGKWIYADGNGDESEFHFVTGWRPAFGFQDHLLRHAAKLDPNVVICLDYDDEMPNFVGARYVLLNEGRIDSFHEEADTSEYTVVMEDDVEDKKQELRDNDEDDSKVIWWQDLWEILHNEKMAALEQMQSEYKRTKTIKLSPY